MNDRKKSEMENLDQKYNIADYFLFDEDINNDNKIEPILKDYISSTENSRDKYFSYLTLAQYYSLTKQVALLENSTQAAMSLYEADDSIPREFIFLIHYGRCVDYAYNNL